jgi:hypothetical protein
MKIPTMIMAGEVAYPGITAAMGDMKTASKNSIATTTEVSPVLPPSSTPDALSTQVVTVDVPITAPAHCRNGIDHKSRSSSGKFALLVQKIRPRRNSNQSANGIKEICKEKGEHNYIKSGLVRSEKSN